MKGMKETNEQDEGDEDSEYAVHSPDEGGVKVHKYFTSGGIKMFTALVKIDSDAVYSPELKRTGFFLKKDTSEEISSSIRRKVERYFIVAEKQGVDDGIPNLSRKQEEDVIDMRFAAVLGFKIKDVPTRLSYSLLDNFDEDAWMMKFYGKSISITRETMKDILGLPMGDVNGRYHPPRHIDGIIVGGFSCNVV
ncbi:hypothetical protein Tco_1074725 [Tanacetum coccineum]